MMRSPPDPAWVRALPATQRTAAGLAYLRDCLLALATPRWDTGLGAGQGDDLRWLMVTREQDRQAKRQFLDAWKRMRRREKKARRRGVLLPVASDDPPAAGPS